MDLILWRHAEAEEGAPDHARKLTAKGVKQAEKIAAFLRRHLPGHTRILVSPATRAQQTATALTRRFTLDPALAPGASAQDVLRVARWPEAGGAVVVVGHQPTLGDVAAHLLGCEDSPPNIKKGALWWFNVNLAKRTACTPRPLRERGNGGEGNGHGADDSSFGVACAMTVGRREHEGSAQVTLRLVIAPDFL